MFTGRAGPAAEQGDVRDPPLTAAVADNMFIANSLFKTVSYQERFPPMGRDDEASDSDEDRYDEARADEASDSDEARGDEDRYNPAPDDEARGDEDLDDDSGSEHSDHSDFVRVFRSEPEDFEPADGPEPGAFSLIRRNTASGRRATVS